MRRVLVIAAHPDDEVYGVGGTIVKHSRAGDEVFVCMLTEGTTLQYQQNKSTIELAKLIEIKKKETEKAASILGVKEVFFFNLPDMQLDTIAHTELNRRIEECIREVKPEIVYTHHWGDVNLDHRQVFNSTIVAVRPGGEKSLRRVLAYETPSSTEWNAPLFNNIFMPNVFVDISDTLEIKLAAMEAYKTELREFPHPRSIQAVKTYAQRNGLIIARPAAECFILIREII